MYLELVGIKYFRGPFGTFYRGNNAKWLHNLSSGCDILQVVIFFADFFLTIAEIWTIFVGCLWIVVSLDLLKYSICRPMEEAAFVTQTDRSC